MIFVLVAPSDPARESLEAAILQAELCGKQLNAIELHRVLVSTLQGNWRLYIRSLEQVLKEQVCLLVYFVLDCPPIDEPIVRSCNVGPSSSRGRTALSISGPSSRLS